MSYRPKVVGTWVGKGPPASGHVDPADPVVEKPWRGRTHYELRCDLERPRTPRCPERAQK